MFFLSITQYYPEWQLVISSDKLGDRGFHSAGPAGWNSFQAELRHITDTDLFKCCTFHENILSFNFVSAPVHCKWRYTNLCYYFLKFFCPLFLLLLQVTTIAIKCMVHSSLIYPHHQSAVTASFSHQR